MKKQQTQQWKENMFQSISEIVTLCDQLYDENQQLKEQLELAQERERMLQAEQLSVAPSSVRCWWCGLS